MYWADFGEPRGSAPAYVRPVVVIQGDQFNQSAIATTVVCSFSTNAALRMAPGNVWVPAGVGGLRDDSVAVVSQIATIDRADLVDYIGRLPADVLREVMAGVLLVLGERPRP